MLQEVVEELLQHGGPDATYVDCTFGRGGHSEELLRRLSSSCGRVVAFDMDPAAAGALRALERREPRFKGHNRPYGDFLRVVDASVTNLEGVLIDLGSQSVFSEERSRGFNYVEDGPLDLRLNSSYGMPASKWLQTVTVEELAWVIHEHGEDGDELLARRLAEGILERQQRLGPYTSALELADACREVKHGVDDRGQHPGRLTLQAIRCFLNHATEQLELAMRAAMERLQPGGRLVVISYKRKEATQVKRFLREHEDADSRLAGLVTPQRLVELYPALGEGLPWSCRQAREPLRPSPAECERSPRARTALAHVLVKEARDPASPCRGLEQRPEAAQFVQPSPLPFVGAA